MKDQHIYAKIREILNRADVDPDSLITRKRSAKHNGDIDVLLEHLSLLVTDLQFQVHANRNELFQIRSLLEQ